MTSVLKNAFIDKLDDIVNRHNNTYHSAIKIKSVNVKPRTCIGFNVEKMIKTKNPKSDLNC